MNTLVYADLFFFITAIAVIVFASACLVLVIYLILISRDIWFIIKLVRGQAAAIHNDIEKIRASISGVSFKDVFAMFRKVGRKAKKKVEE
ncbi:MAG: hypothetical protein V1489_02625 [Candidatus Liptonbacteria bacterium]